MLMFSETALKRASERRVDLELLVGYDIQALSTSGVHSRIWGGAGAHHLVCYVMFWIAECWTVAVVRERLWNL